MRRESTQTQEIIIKILSSVLLILIKVKCLEVEWLVSRVEDVLVKLDLSNETFQNFENFIWWKHI